MRYARMSIEVESPEEVGYDRIAYNLSESSVRDRSVGEFGLDLDQLVLLYGAHRGQPELREAVAALSGVPASDVLVTAGAAQALFIVATALLEPGDELVVVRPNYATNLETPRAIGATIKYLDLDFDHGWALDVDALAGLLTARTSLVSITVPHNPTGQVVPAADLARIVGLVESAGARLLVDETYRELTFGADPAPVVAATSDRVISVSSLSKAYGVPGIRVGWLITHDPGLMEVFLAAKEQIGICGSVVDEEIAYRALAQRDEWLPGTRARLTEALATTTAWLAGEDRLEWVAPRGGVVAMPRIRSDAGVRIDEFYRVLTGEFGTYVGPGHWFEQDRHYFRLGFGWPTPEELAGGLAGISAALTAAT